jgi:NitT/TauT family transport system ATP-binding protein
MIEVKDLRVEYESRGGKITVIEGISFEVACGESLAIIGPSGCGKSSLLYSLCGLIKPSWGRITVDGEEVSGVRRDVALILQDVGLLPWKTVWRNAMLGLELDGRGGSRWENQKKVKEILAELKILEFQHRYPSQLSGGQKQMVGLARALAVDPKVCLMDEPLGALDAISREKLQDTILNLWRRRGLTMVLVTHDIEEAVFLGQRIAVLSPRPAKIKAIVENPSMGQPGWRASEEFYIKARELRRLLEIG